MIHNCTIQSKLCLEAQKRFCFAYLLWFHTQKLCSRLSAKKMILNPLPLSAFVRIWLTTHPTPCGRPQQLLLK